MPSSLRQLLTKPLPAPPEGWRRGPFRSGTFTSQIRSERTTSVLGLWLALTFGICFVTGLISHLIQHPVWFVTWPTRPISLYRITQGVHVVTGLATIPLLLAKLWSVFPKLFAWPPVKRLAEVASRLGILVLVGTAVFQLASGLVNLARWYVVMPFFFTTAHYWTAWIAVGALIMHIGAKATIARSALRAPTADKTRVGHKTHESQRSTTGAIPKSGGLTRRGFFAAVGAATAVVALSTAGQTIPFLRRVSLLAPRDPKVGPQGLPVNKSAVEANVGPQIDGAAYRLSVAGAKQIQLSLNDLDELTQYTIDLPIACVEGWSANATWTGVRLRDVLALAGFNPQSTDTDHVVRVASLQPKGRYRSSDMQAYVAADPLALLATKLGGNVLHIDHGYPLRLITPNRPGVLQTKWVNEISVHSSGQS